MISAQKNITSEEEEELTFHRHVSEPRGVSGEVRMREIADNPNGYLNLYSTRKFTSIDIYKS